MTRWGVVSGFLALTIAGCSPRNAPVAVTGPASPKGWEVRYNAALALVRRGSESATDETVWESLQEMLDEEQQLRNFRRKLPNGTEVSDDGPARLTVVAALQAIREFHKIRPKADLASLHVPIEKLTSSSNALVRKEAKETQLVLKGQ